MPDPDGHHRAHAPGPARAAGLAWVEDLPGRLRSAGPLVPPMGDDETPVVFSATLRALNEAHQGFALADGFTGRLVLVNDALCQMLGCGPGELLEVGSWRDLTGPGAHGPPPAGPVAVAAPALGEQATIEVSWQRVPSVSHDLWMAVARKGRATEEGQAARGAQNGPQGPSRAGILNLVAHELRTPITPIKIQLSILRAPGSEPLSPRQENAVALIERNVSRLEQTVSDLLTAARVSGGAPANVRPLVDLAVIGEEVVEERRARARDAGITLSLITSEDVLARGNSFALRKALGHLVDNALRLTPSGGSVQVMIAARDGESRVTVEDTGRGFRPEEARSLFLPFSHLRDPMEDPGARAGLGLYIMRGIVEQHGGRVWAESQGPGRGATFGFAIPTRAWKLEERNQARKDGGGAKQG